MADPFEVRMRFSSQLQHLNASVVSAQKAAQYAMKNKEMCEDLHSCILEQLEMTSNSMNTRANIMYFIEPFLDLASREPHASQYLRMMQRDMIRVVDAVCPEDGSGAANAKVVRKVLAGLNAKDFLTNDTMTEIEGCLKERDVSHADVGLSPPMGADDTDNRSRRAQVESQPQNRDADIVHGGGVNGASQHRSGAAGANGGKAADNRNVPNTLEKRQIEQRIEEDRERHKKRRENMWVVPRDPMEEMHKFIEETSDVNSDDEVTAKEQWKAFVEISGRKEESDTTK